MELRIMEDSAELAREAAEFFVWLGKEAIRTGGRFCVVLSGGSTPRALHAILAGPDCSEQLDWRQVWFFFGDERGVPPDHPESNFAMAEETLFRPLKIAPGQIARMKAERADLDEAARAYEAAVRTHFGVHPPACPRFDLILLGLGADGHTASLFPDTAALEERTRLVVPTQSPKGIKNRLTLTASAINQAKTVVFLASGAGKAEAVSAVIEGRTRPDRPDRLGQEDRRFPARLIHPVNGRLIWFVDRAAAARLTVAQQGIVSHEE
ncbi:MAG: 6-phosphogluconolactonase [Nitrospirae bacterium]|nr:MAG: 6-phosphogluconolactonase [Nitrospirota bacterium]